VSVSEKSINMSMALLLVATVLSPFAVAPAAADTFNKTVQSSESVQIDTSGVSQAKIEISGTYTTSSGSEVTHKLIRKTVTGDSKYYLVDRQAYDSYSVTVTTESSTASVTISGESYRIGGPGYTRLGHTGGDTNLVCGTGGKINQILGGYYTDCNPVPSQSTDVSNVTSSQTALDLYANLNTQATAAENYNTTVRNYLQDTQSIALLEGKNAYIRALNNGSSKTAAETAAVSAVNDYYTSQQLELINRYNQTAANLKYAIQTAKNESGLTPNDVVRITVDSNADSDVPGGLSFTETATLINGSSKDYTRISTYYGSFALNGNHGADHDYIITTEAPTSDYSDKKYVHLNKTFHKNYVEMESQASSVRTEMKTFVENTYTDYQQGELNNSELIDPYLAQREYGPAAGQNFSAWAATSLTLLGANSPETLESTGSFTVSDGTENGTEYVGLLLSDENPASGGFSAGTTYDAAQLNGTQYVVTDQEVHELTGSFTVSEITNANGNTVQNVTYKNVTYQSTNTSQFGETLNQIAQTQAELDARLAALNTVAGGGTGGGSGAADYVADLLNSVGAPVNPLTRAGAVAGVGVGGLALIARVIGG
jgi:hypothetical protein